MMKRTGYILALTLVATTLCAGHLLAAGPGVQADVRPASEKLVARLTRSFSRTVSHSPQIVDRTIAAPLAQPTLVVSTSRAHEIDLSPLQLHLPPPLV